MSTKTKLTSAQIRTLNEIIEIADKGTRKYYCIIDYKPAIILLKLGYVKKIEVLSDKYRMALLPTVEGRNLIGMTNAKPPYDE